MFIAVRILGAFPYKCVDGIYTLSLWGCLYSCALLVWVVADFVVYVFIRLPPFADTPLYLVICQKFSTILAAFLPILSHRRNTRYINSIYQRIRKLDRILRCLGLEPRDKNPSRLTFFLYLTNVIIRIIEGDFERGKGRFIAGILRFSVIFGLVLRINHDIRLLCTRLILLKREVIRLSIFSGPDKLRRLQILCKCHRSACQISETMNDMYSFQILLLIGCISLHITSQLYIITIHHQRWEDVSILGLAATDSGMVIPVILVCATATLEAQKFNKELYKLMVYSEWPSFAYDHALRIHILGYWKVVFTAGGIFEVDIPVFQSIIGATANYVVMLMQYGAARKRPPPLDHS